jgi:hypothetical protein
MNGILRDLLSDRAEAAGTPDLDLDELVALGERRVSRRRRAALGGTAAAVALTVGASIAITQVGEDRTSPPVDPSTRLDPIRVHGLSGHGGLRLDNDLAVGQARAAVTNATDVFVVTAADGAYHRLRLPGYDPSLHDGSLGGAERPGVALSPDGLRLAYAWHAPILTDNPAWEESYHVPSGVRVLDLTTGTVTAEVKAGPYPPAIHHTFWSVEKLDSHLRWSGDGRYLAYYDTFGVFHGAWGTEGGAQVEILDTTGRVGAVQESPVRLDRLIDDSPPGPHTPFVSARDGARVVDDRLFAWRLDSGAAWPPTAIGDGWASGAFLSGRRVLLGPSEVGDSLLDVDLRTGQQVEVRVLHAEQWPEGATIELLGTAGPDVVVASVRRVTDGRVADDADLVLLDLSRSDSEPVATEVGHVANTSGSIFSFATDTLADNIPRTDSEESVAKEPASGREAESSHPPDPSRGPDPVWLSLAAVVLALGAALAMMIRRRPRS